MSEVGVRKRRQMIPPRHRRRYTGGGDGRGLRGYLTFWATRRRADAILRRYEFDQNDLDAFDAVGDIFEHEKNRMAAAQLRRLFALIASWVVSSLLAAPVAAIEPEPLVSQLVDDLVTAPHAPTSAGATLLAA
jgi:hypothetical protein